VIRQSNAELSLRAKRITSDVEGLKDNPRRLGKGEVRLVGQAPLKPGREARGRRQDSPVPLAAFARCQYTRKRNLAARDDEKPFRVESSSSGRFRA
jgi:hypothetical protein